MDAVKRVALVTGASRGLGRVIAGVLAQRGHDLVIGARECVALRRAADEMSVGGGRVVAVEGDITDASVRQRWIDAAGALGGLDLLVNNASELGGIGPLRAFEVPRLG